MTCPCDSLAGRMHDICAGTSGLPEAKRRAYVERWVADGRLPESALSLLPPRGFGDTVKWFTDATGITAAAKLVEKITGLPCGCEGRQAKLNALLPYGDGPAPTASDHESPRPGSPPSSAP